MNSWLEHNAIKVQNMDWYVQFFDDVFGMKVRKIMGQAPKRKIWLWGGIQLNETIEFHSPEGREEHLGIMTDNVIEVLEKAYAYGVAELQEGHNWIQLPDGLHIEVIGGKPDVIQQAISLKPWIECDK